MVNEQHASDTRLLLADPGIGVLADAPNEVEIKPDAETSSVELTINVTGEQTKNAYDRVVVDASKNMDIPGFRKGSKIPANVIESVLEGGNGQASGGKNLLRKQALKQLVGLVETVLSDHPTIDPIGQPEIVQNEDILVQMFTPGEPMQLIVKTDVWPTISWVDAKPDAKVYEGLEASYSRKPFNQGKYEQALKDLKDRQAKLAPKGDASAVLEMGDACVVNMVGYMADESGGKGEPLPNAASGDQVDVVMETGKYMEGLVEGIVGAKVDDVREIKVVFPSFLKDKTLAGKTAIFDVTVLSVDTRTLPELDDEFANAIRPGLTKDGLLEEVKNAVDSEDAKEFTAARNKALEGALASKVSMVIPDTLITMQCREKYALMLTDMRDNGTPDSEIKKLVTPENFEKYKDIARPNIERDLKASMAVEEVAKFENIRVAPEEIEEQMANIKKEVAQSGEEYDEQQMRGKVEATLLRNQVMDHLASLAEISVTYEEEAEFDEELMDEIMEKQAAAERERVEKIARAAEEEEKKM
ncbi:hypothetical protein TrRE_jg3675 [Triparma retinervis]|uniref:peptidylprolyl isomerase n=1 Tax=Triparma retinervis TaxID=2557542 RepID=A0A9W7DN19_9STRA|nr:hypothetical protein TrRE_jg3675 [Triparma retinervis]